MANTKQLLINALERTELGASLFADRTAVDAAAESLLPLVREAQSKAVDDLAWQWWLRDMSAAETRERLHLLARGIKEGTLWETA